LKDVDVCKTFRIPEYEPAVEFASVITNGALHFCPYLPGRIEVVNLTNFDIIEAIDGSEPALIHYEKDWAEKVMKKYFFKGELRGLITIKTKTDQKGLQASAIYTIAGPKMDTF